MPERENKLVRIYCICGQKMKVSSDMHGLPGKCVACRQKIRIPRPDQVPEGTVSVYLKDHPEFLRKVKKAPGSGTKAPSKVSKPPSRAGERREDITLGEGEKISTVALDVLEPLRSLCSIHYKLERQLEALDRYAEGDDASHAEIEGYQARVGRVRSDLDDQLRQILMEVAIELSSTQEKIVQEGLAARVGDESPAAYAESVDRLRRRRDRLERRKHNLRGWLATSDPHMAGGYIDLSVDSIPADGFSISVPSDREESESLLSIHMSGLRDALYRHGHAVRKLEEIDRMEQSAHGIKETRLDCKAERKIASGIAAFYRERLDQLNLDNKADSETAKAQASLARGRLQVGEIDRVRHDAIAKDCQRAQTAAAKAKLMIERALRASRAQDVPLPRGTLLGRIAVHPSESTLGVDAIIGWVSALLLGVSIFLPAVGDLSLVQAFLEYGSTGSSMRWIFLAPIGAGVALALLAGLPYAIHRGKSFAGLWVVCTAALAYAINEAGFGLDPMAEGFRAGGGWLARPGLAIMVIADIGIFAAAFAALGPLKKARAWLPASLGAGAFAVLLIATQGFGRYLPLPEVSSSEGGIVPLGQSGAGGLGRQISLAIANGGKRELHLVRTPSGARNAYLYVLERRIGENSWAEVTGQAPAFGDTPGAGTTIAPSEQANVMAALPQGQYRVLLHSSAASNTQEFPFTVSVPESAASMLQGKPPNLPGPLPGVRDRRDDGAAAPARAGLEVELGGIMTGPGVGPIFSMVLHHPGGRSERQRASVGQALYGAWVVSEFNESLNTVTISNGEDILILSQGERVALRD